MYDVEEESDGFLSAYEREAREVERDCMDTGICSRVMWALSRYIKWGLHPGSGIYRILSAQDTAGWLDPETESQVGLILSYMASKDPQRTIWGSERAVSDHIQLMLARR